MLYFLGRCRLTNLQIVTSDLKFRVILHIGGDKIMCSSSSGNVDESIGADGPSVRYGVMKFPLPIIRNYPTLKINNTVYQNM